MIIQKLKILTKETFFMLKKHKMYVLAPLFLVMIFLALLVYHVGPAVVISFIYAGV